MLRVPEGMTLNCTNGDAIGSVCSWKLINPKKYKLVGIFKSVCKSDRTWSVLTPPQFIEKSSEFQKNYLFDFSYLQITWTNVTKLLIIVRKF